MSKLQNVTLEQAFCLQRCIPVDSHHRDADAWCIIGRLEDGTPFLLHYCRGVTFWDCTQQLGEGIRRKIIRLAKEQLLQAVPLPAFAKVHNLRPLDMSDIQTSNQVAQDLSQAFLKEVWRAQYLNDRDEDYLYLQVPFAEKGLAKQLGAKWDGERKQWKVKRQADMSAFAAWLAP